VTEALQKLLWIVDSIGHKLTESVDHLSLSCAESLVMTTLRMNINIDLLVTAICGCFIACPLGLLLWLTDSSPILRAVVWFLFISLCFRMVLDYFEQSKRTRANIQYVERTKSRETSFNYYSLVTKVLD